MKKRILSLILCICMLFSSELFWLPANSAETTQVGAAPTTVSVLHDGRRITALSLEQHEKEVLSAELSGIEAKAYQWQILIDPENDAWVSIYDKTKQNCDVSLALVNSLLDDQNCAYLRCAITDEDDAVYYSENVRVTIMFDAEDAGNVTSFDAPEYTQAATNTPTMFSTEKSTENVTKYVKITINYLDFESHESGVEASIYSPYTAIIEKNSEFIQNVISPTYLGFAPFYDADPPTTSNDEIVDDASVIIFNYASVTEDIVINVYYKPIEVNYAVRYFFQNVNDDLYTENASLYHMHQAKTGTIIKDDELKAHAGDTTGFSKMYHIPEAVAADGSTVFECYYDRLYYLLNFDNNGGYGVDPVYARFGTPFVVNDPVKYGYEFSGWDLLTKDSNGDGVPDTGNNVADELPTTIEALNDVEGNPVPTYYKALWTAVNTTYTVVYWKENANDTGYTYWGHAEKAAKSATFVSAIDTAAADGMTDAAHFTFNPVLSDKNVMVAGDGTTIVNAYYTRNRYTITFKATGLCKIPTGHTHNKTCYLYDEHTHNNQCSLTCSVKEHTHDTECQCILTEHTHTDANGCYGNCNGCTGSSHNHVLSCFTTQTPETVSGTAATLANSIKSPQNGYVYRYRSGNTTYNATYYNFFYCADVWYRLDISSSTNTQTSNGVSYRISQNPSKNNSYTSVQATRISHTHTNKCISCLKPVHVHGTNCEYDHGVHTHTDACYSCGQLAHTHTDNCFDMICTIPEGHSHSTTCTNANKTNTVKLVTRKYEQSLADIWPVTDDNGNTYDSGERWKPSESSYYKEVLVYIATMPDENFTLTLDSGEGRDTFTLNYYLEVLDPNTDPYDKTYTINSQRKYFVLANVIKANYNHVTKDEDFFDITGFERAIADPDFGNGTSVDPNDLIVDFYYTRTTTHYIEFNNNGTVTLSETGIPYGDHLHDHKITDHNGKEMDMYLYVPPYPSNLEPNAYYFDGWYTSPGCFDGTEVDWDTINMPDNDLMFYAKWSPQSHTVRFFETLDDMNAYEDGDTSIETFRTFENIVHGNVVGTISSPERTENGQELVFAGWFYLENGSKKAFAPTNMPINKDLNIFADWSSHTPQPYHIEYVLATDKTTKVADAKIGYAYAGSTKTFLAKAGAPYNELYPQYNSGYFPTIASHSITIQYELDQSHPVNNVYTFEYVRASDIQYTVRYVNKKTNVVIKEVSKTTSDAVVTERFEPVENMIPDAFYKRLVISVKWDAELNQYVGTDDNVVTFYYTPTETSAYYAVHFMLEKLHDPSLSASQIEALRKNYALDGSGGYEETGTHIEGIGDIDTDVIITPQEFAGFTLVKNARYSVGGVLQNESISYSGSTFTMRVTEEGTELYIFYTRISYKYKVHYYEYNTTNSLHASISGESIYGSKLTFDAASVDGYTCVSQTTQTLEIRDKEEQNVLIFYYAPIQYVVEYIVADPVPPETDAWLSKTIEVKAGNETFDGSTPQFNDKYYRFVGWFKDAACTVSASDVGTVEGNTFIPDKAKLSETESNKFYAKFELLLGDLTITRSDAEEGQVFVYTVTNTATGETVQVTIVGNNSVTIRNLLLGQYTVTQENDWSWRYDGVTDASQSISHTGATTVQFTIPLKNEQWLSGNSNLISNKYTEE